MEMRKGIGVSPGVAISTAVVLDAEALVIPRRTGAAEDVPMELDRLGKAIAQTIVDLAKLRDEVTTQHGREIGGIFDFHIGMLKDKTLLKQFPAEITTQHTTAEYAVSVVMRRYANLFLQMANSTLSERVKDVYDIEKRLLRSLIGQKHEDMAHLKQDIIVIAHDLLPSQTAALDKVHVKGFATDVGGRTSHTAIVARAMGIPAVVGLGNITSEITGGDTVIINGDNGVVIINPDEEQLAEYREAERGRSRMEVELSALRELPAQTTDGHMVSLQANIEFPGEIDDAVYRGAEGIGLYRTEFLYMASPTEPTEEDHFVAYAEALKRLNGRPLVIRTLDLGADKYTQAKAQNPERNPFLGDRSIRMCLHDIPMFKRQLRAIMRCSVMGDVRIMFPMISTLLELRQAKMILNDVIEEMEDEGLEFRRDIPVGIMIEVPAAALMAEQFCKGSELFLDWDERFNSVHVGGRSNQRTRGRPVLPGPSGGAGADPRCYPRRRPRQHWSVRLW